MSSSNFAEPFVTSTPKNTSNTIDTNDAPDNLLKAPLGGGLFSVSANARSTGETVAALLMRLADAARDDGLAPIQANVFCDCELGRSADAGAFGFPVAFLGRHDSPRGCVLSARLTAIATDTNRQSLFDDHGAVCGTQWETSDARYLLLGALTPPDTALPRDQQSAAAWRLLKTRLEQAGFTLGNLVRTWFFNDHILDWYNDFNRVRNAFFTEHNIFGTLVPASTGVGASNATGAALSLDALAIAPKQNATGASASASAAGATTAMRIEAVTSPLQCAAYDYKSAFSRAVECTASDGSRHLLVSGTASIEPGGKTIHQGDLDAQIDLSLRVVEAILKSRGMDWSDTARAILYFPEIEWMPRWEARRVALGMPPIPGIFAHCDICRDDLLFEIEIDACKEKEAGK